jgi:hypothetical protein
MKRAAAFSFGSAVVLAWIVLSGAWLTNATPNQQASATIGVLDESRPAFVVNSTADSGPGTLRQALLDAQNGDTIAFDPTVFPPTAPVTIAVLSELPHIHQGNLTIDASNAGVILDGSSIGNWAAGLEVSSNANTVQGLQFTNFNGAGIVLSGQARDNTIGGDRSLGSGPLGRGNLIGSGEIGIGLWDKGTSFNTILGNLIGTDAFGADTLKNNGSGIWISEGATHNTIGPDNAIAYNGACGVEIRGADSIANTITRNSIHDNEHKGIQLLDGGNTELIAPLIIDFDLAAGTVAGGACPNCTVQIFSDDEDEGKVYEGQTAVNGIGTFVFTKSVPLSGPHLTATATDLGGNTSGFSASTSGTSRSVILQKGSALTRMRFLPRPSGELEDNRLGQMFRVDIDTQQEASDLVEQNTDLGLKWARLSVDYFDWPEVEETGAYSEYNIDAAQDQVIAGLAENGVEIMYTLVFWDEAIQAGEGYSRFKTEEEIQRYLNYVVFVVNHFKGQIQYYEILNEPNIREGTQQYVQVAEYINLLTRVAPVIRQEDPQAKIVAGAIASLSEPGAQDYLLSILSSDAMPIVDAVSWHLHNRESPDYAPEYYDNYPFLVEGLKDIASAHGFEGAFIAEELHFRTPKNPDPREPSIYSETVSAKYHARGIVKHRGMDLMIGLALEETEQLPLIASAVRSLGTVLAGAEPVSLVVEIQSEATDVVSYTFSLSNGDHLIALWTDGVAVDDGPGVPAALTIPGFTQHSVTGIDVLHGFQQQMITSEEDGNLVIRDLLIKDYPILFRITPTKSLFLPIILEDATVSGRDR